MTTNNIYHLPINDLKPYKNNARTHSRKQIKQLVRSIKEFGFTNPILIDEDNRILAGHGRVLAAKEMGMTEVPCVRLDHMSEAQKRAYILADNKLALNAGWDEELLAEELGFLLSDDVSFDVDVTGFSISEVDMIIEDSHKQEPHDPADDLPVSDKGMIVVKQGDLWQLGPHRLICGDSLDPECVAALMDGEKARMVFTDPPYNVPIDGFVGGKGKIKHHEFAMASGELTEDEFITFLKTAFKNLTGHSMDGSIHFICMDWRHMDDVSAVGREIYDARLNLCIWNKSNAGMGSLYRSKHELVFVYRVGSSPHLNMVELGRHGRNRTNVWDYASVNSMKGSRREDLALHPTVKPTGLVADALRDVTRHGDLVLDTFLGSGTTLIAAERIGRCFRGMDIDPAYVDVAIERWSALTGREPELEPAP